MPKITPFLWFNNQAEEAVHFYVSVFKNSQVLNITRGPGEKAMVVTFELDGQPFAALNGGSKFAFTEAVSFSVDCKNQLEVDELWETLSEGGAKGQCGWLKDKYGLSWQIVPSILPKLLADGDREKAGRVMKAMMQMTKIDIEALQKAYDQA